MLRSLGLIGLGLAAPLCTGRAQSVDPETVSLPRLDVHSERVANQEPTGAMAMPISGLRFEPQVDVQARNLAEGQADVAIRGGTFANTSFQLAALPLHDPQTGHYAAEVPIAPDLLQPPQIRTGARHAREAWNASAGSVAYQWAPVRSGGHVAASVGAKDTYRFEGYAAATGERGVAADVAFAHSASDGTIAFGDHRFTRYNGRLQWTSDWGQTDVFAGYQSKFFGWPNLYTPFNSPETEDIETVLVSASHRVEWGAEGSTIDAGLYYRRNHDNYAFNRFAPVGPVPPFEHTTWVTGAGLTGRWVASPEWAVAFRGAVLADEIESTSLVFGSFASRTYLSAGLYPERTFALGPGRELTVSAGAAFDTTNRDASALSPVLEIAVEDPSRRWSRWSVSYAGASQVADYTALNGNPAAGLFRGNRHLGRAESHNLEAGGEFAMGAWRGSAALFYRRDDDLVDWTFQQGVTARLASAVDIEAVGAELFASRSLGWLDVMLGYAWLEKTEDYGGAVVDGSFYALNFPRHRLTLALIARPTAHLEIRLDNEARLQEPNPLRRGGDDALISALGIYWRTPWARQLQLSAQVDNLWNEDFEEVPAVPAGRRLVTVGARYDW